MGLELPLHFADPIKAKINVGEDQSYLNCDQWRNHFRVWSGGTDSSAGEFDHGMVSTGVGGMLRCLPPEVALSD